MNLPLPKASAVVCINPVTGYSLASSRRNEPTRMGLVGGKVDPGETPEQAAKREFFEETGYQLSDSPLVFISQAVDNDGYQVYLYGIRNPTDIENICNQFVEDIEVEPGIVVKFVPYSELLNGPFGEYNKWILDGIFVYLTFAFFSNVHHSINA